MKEPKLRYLTRGRRDYGVSNVSLMSRPFWEFQTVIDGEIAPETRSGVQAFGSHTIWISEPGHHHSWVCRSGKTAEVTVFHFTAPEAELVELVQGNGGMLALKLEDDDVQQIRDWHASIRPEYLRPNALTHLKVRQILDGFTLLILERAGYSAEPLIDDLDAERVDQALYWYERNLPWHPQVSDVAKAIGVSEVHLRRIFAKRLGRSPKATFQDIMLRYADGLLRDTQMNLDEIAESCGYTNGSSFSRAYRAAHGCSPGSVRGERPGVELV